jgi:hypothetical protein
VIPEVPQFCYALCDILARTNAAIKGEVLNRLVQLALRHVDRKEPAEPLRKRLALIRHIDDQTQATSILSARLRYDVPANTRRNEGKVVALLSETPSGATIMHTLLDRDIEQGVQRGTQKGGAAVILR